MTDVYELSIVLNLRQNLSDEEVAEIRWHLGLGPKPEILHIVPAFPIVVEDDRGELVTEDDPVPLLGRRGEAWKVDGALGAAAPGGCSLRLMGSDHSAGDPPRRIRPHWRTAQLAR